MSGRAGDPRTAKGAQPVPSAPLEVGSNAHHRVEVPEWTLLLVRAADVAIPEFEPLP